MSHSNAGPSEPARTHTITAGKYRGLSVLADDRGVFRMIAVDQRPPIFAALAAHDGRRPEQVGYDEVSTVKLLLTSVLAPASSAVLVDPIWTHAGALAHVPGSVGLMSTLEDHAFEVRGGERYSRVIEGWSVAKIKRSAADGVKLLVWHRPDAGGENLAHQDELVTAVGAACREHDIPFVLELLVYPLTGEDASSAEYVRAKPQRVLASIRHYTQARFGVDMLKVEFPTDLKFVAEFSSGAFDGRPREAVHDLADTRGFLAELDSVATVPWVMLTAGVTPREFETQLELATEAGASGFLAGRAVWLDALSAYPDLGAVEKRLRSKSLPYLNRISAVVEAARPWTSHRRYQGGPIVSGAGEGWFKEY